MSTKIELLEALLREVSNDVYELYNEYADTTPPELYGALLGIHTKIDMGLKDQYTPEALRQSKMANRDEIREKLRKALDVRWHGEPFDTEQYGYHFIITADDRSKIIGNIVEALALLKEQPCKTPDCQPEKKDSE